MFKIKINFLTFFVMSILISSFSQAQSSRSGYSVRYHTTYQHWDSSFYSYYNYSEREYYTQCNYHTCYDTWNDYDTVYVEETIVQDGRYSGYTQVTVYRSSNYDRSRRYVTYYTHNGRVVHRDYYHGHRHIRNGYYYSSHYRSVNYVVLDEFTASIILGTHFVGLGAEVLSHCDSDDTACLVLGLASSASGSAMSISASIREKKRSDFQRYLEDDRRRNEERIIDNSFDID